MGNTQKCRPPLEGGEHFACKVSYCSDRAVVVVEFTFDLNVLQQHWFHHLPSDQDTSGPPVQDVCTRLEIHLEPNKTGTQGQWRIFRLLFWHVSS